MIKSCFIQTIPRTYNKQEYPLNDAGKALLQPNGGVFCLFVASFGKISTHISVILHSVKESFIEGCQCCIQYMKMLWSMINVRCGFWEKSDENIPDIYSWCCHW